ncbi:transposase, IS204/IS1001/IS1096/IS1165 family protein [Streptomyces lincolnensis]|uniref:Transposase, IS204/IS1001/IS1096/IS1165 family protein n=1 Tax=Streptomyces lincolnensis TaxID=1915 RepID=A0A1B1MPX0_STRLN|nr:transposase, IS204/IS1001/IS1096/IS1165 family protein [Streptomyces lincolnensis]
MVAPRDRRALPYSNGPTEGVNTKTKRITRQMHGGAGFTLLRHRIPSDSGTLRHHRK